VTCCADPLSARGLWTDPDERVRGAIERERREGEDGVLASVVAVVPKLLPALSAIPRNQCPDNDVNAGRERVEEESEGVVVSLLITCNAMK